MVATVLSCAMLLDADADTESPFMVPLAARRAGMLSSLAVGNMGSAPAFLTRLQGMSQKQLW